MLYNLFVISLLSRSPISYDYFNKIVNCQEPVSLLEWYKFKSQSHKQKFVNNSKANRPVWKHFPHGTLFIELCLISNPILLLKVKGKTDNNTLMSRFMHKEATTKKPPRSYQENFILFIYLCFSFKIHGSMYGESWLNMNLKNYRKFLKS